MLEDLLPVLDNFELGMLEVRKGDPKSPIVVGMEMIERQLKDFMTNAGVYYHNFYFRSKMVLLVLAGLNMAMFELTAGKSVAKWDEAPAAPRAGKAAAVASIVIWIAVICAGRIIGFTTTRTAAKTQPPASVNFDDFLGGGPGGPPCRA